MKEIERRDIISITDSAAHRIRFLLSENKDAIAIRVRVKSGGCAGLSYVVEYAKEQDVFDQVIKCADIHIFIDKKAVLYIIGSVMDYVEEMFKSGFVFTNPKEKDKCGCGKSFNV